MSEKMMSNHSSNAPTVSHDNNVNASVIPGTSVSEVSTPFKVVQVRMAERHRDVFNRRMFPSLFGEDGQLKPTNEHPNTSFLSSEMTQLEWNQAVEIITNFGPLDKKQVTEEQLLYRKRLPKVVRLNWTKQYNGERKIDKYKVEQYRVPGSDEIKLRLLRKFKRLNWSDERWLECVPQLEVFDVIKECHEINGHFKQNQTCLKVHERFYNITEKQVAAFIQTCETCNHVKQKRIWKSNVLF
jgi:hypothetical protein